MESFFADVFRTFQIFVASFVILIVGYNFNARWPRFPWDLTVDRFGFHVYIPIITAMGASILLTIILRVFGVGTGFKI